MNHYPLQDSISFRSSVQQCRVIGCTQPTSASAQEGLNQRFCRKHEDFYKRHGSYYRTSYKAHEIKPYFNLALEWLRAHQALPTVHRAILAVKALYKNGGQHIEAFRLRGLTPHERARAAWARLRQAQIDPMRPLAASLAIELMTLHHPDAEHNTHFKRVQKAKVIHRMASGTHKSWERTEYDGKTRVTEIHIYPRSRGRVLVHMGQDIELASELLVAYHLEEVWNSKVY